MIDRPALLSLPDIDRRLQAGGQWIARSIEVTGAGSAAYYQLGSGWSAAYPETTGYLIETMLELADTLSLPAAEKSALDCVDWLCDLQQPDGSFPSGVGGQGPPLIFDTGQIVFGLLAGYRRSGQDRHREALNWAVDWLLAQWQQDGWSQAHYVAGHQPAYYTRVTWAMLAADQLLQRPEIAPSMSQALAAQLQRIQANGTISGWELHPGRPALTHTMAYTLRGMLESGRLLENTGAIAAARRVADTILERYSQTGKLAATYTTDWQGNYRYYCVTGHAQFALVFFWLEELTGEMKYSEAAHQLLSDILPAQCLLPWLPMYGGVSGSYPFWGPYQRFRWTNWGLKFFLDALLASRARARARASDHLT